MDYIRNIGGLASDTVDKIMGKVDNDLELAMRIDPNVGIPDDYPFHKSVENYSELETACRLRLMFGDPLDAQYYCDKAEKELAKILGNDPNLQTATAGHIGTPDPKTYPSNPYGVKLIGNKQPSI